jgi:hypothetical protein
MSRTPFSGMELDNSGDPQGLQLSCAVLPPRHHHRIHRRAVRQSEACIASWVKLPEAQIRRIINDPRLRFALASAAIMIYVNFTQPCRAAQGQSRTWRET